MLKEMIPFPYPVTEEEEYQMKKEFTQKLNEAFDEFFGKIGDIDGEVWIGKKDSLLYRTKIEKEINLNKIEPTAKGKINFILDLNFSNFDQPVKIAVPKEYKTLEEILKPLFEQIPTI